MLLLSSESQLVVIPLQPLLHLHYGRGQGKTNAWSSWQELHKSVLPRTVLFASCYSHPLGQSVLWAALGAAATKLGLATQLECVGCPGGSLFRGMEEVLSPILP